MLQRADRADRASRAIAKMRAANTAATTAASTAAATTAASTSTSACEEAWGGAGRMVGEYVSGELAQVRLLLIASDCF